MPTNAHHEKRVFPRKLFHVQGELVDAIADGRSPIELQDISAGGISFLSSSKIERGNLWLVRFPLNGRTMHGVIRIAYCLNHEPNNDFRLGAEFLDWEEPVLEVVRRYLA